MKIMVFLHGTTIMHASGVLATREQRVRQVIDREKSVSDFSTYVPVGEAPQKLRAWQQQGAEIIYLSPQK